MALTRISSLCSISRKEEGEGAGVATRNRAVAFWAAIKGVIVRAEGAERGYWQEEGH